MAGSRRKRKSATISYQEVDSDNDMQDEVWQVASSKAPPTPAPRAIRKARKTSKKAKSKSKGPLETFLNAPLDVLAEICSHLESPDLVRLASTSKLFRSLLLSRSSRSIWAEARRAAGLPEIKDLTETKYAFWLYGTHCMECGLSRKTVKVDFLFLTRHCSLCRKLLVTPGKGIASIDLHPYALDCSSSSNLGLSGSSRNVYYLTSELMEVNSTLLELQEVYETARHVYASTRLATGSRTRKLLVGVAAAEEPKSVVQPYIAQRRQEVTRRKKQGEAIAEVMSRIEASETGRFERERDAAWKALKLDLEVNEWLEADIQWYRSKIFEPLYWTPTRQPVKQGHRQLIRPVESCPSRDADDWAAIKDQVEQIREEEETLRRAQEAHWKALEHQWQQSSSLKNYSYSPLRNEHTDFDFTTFPRFDAFKYFSSVRPLWDSGATLNRQAWNTALDDIKQEVEDYRIATRVKAITTILAANNDVPLDSLSIDPDDYPEDQYGDAFFSKLTSHFYHAKDGAQPYPSCLTFGRLHFHDNPPQPVYLPEHLRRSRIIILQAILAATGLDSETTTIKDVFGLGRTLLWPECSNPARAALWWTPLELLTDHLAHGWNNKLVAPPALVYGPEVDDPTMDLDVSFDGDAK